MNEWSSTTLSPLIASTGRPGRTMVSMTALMSNGAAPSTAIVASAVMALAARALILFASAGSSWSRLRIQVWTFSSDRLDGVSLAMVIAPGL